MADFYAARAGTNAGAPLDGFLTAVHILLVRQPQRPDEAQKELASFPTPEAANEYLRSNFPEAASQG